MHTSGLAGLTSRSWKRRMK